MFSVDKCLACGPYRAERFERESDSQCNDGLDNDCDGEVSRVTVAHEDDVRGWDKLTNGISCMATCSGAEWSWRDPGEQLRGGYHMP